MKKYLSLLLLVVAIIPLSIKAETIEKKGTISTEQYPIVGITKDSNGNIYTVGNYEEDQFQKYDSNMNLIFSKSLSGYTACTGVATDKNDNVYTICRKTQIFAESHVPHLVSNIYELDYLIKWDESGNKLYEKSISESNNYTGYYTIETKNNEIYIVGVELRYSKYLRDEEDLSFYEYKRVKILNIYNFDGTLLKKIRLGQVEGIEELGYFNTEPSAWGYGPLFEKTDQIIFDDDYFYVVTMPANGELYYGKYDLDGNRIWEKELGVGGDNALTSLTKSNDDNFIAVGYISSNNINEIEYTANRRSPIILKFSKDGKILDYKIIDGKGKAISILNKDNGYYVAARFQEENIPDINNTTRSNYLLKYDYNLNIKDSIETSSVVQFIFDIYDDGICLLENHNDISNYISNEGNIEKEEITLLLNDSYSLKKIFKDIENLNNNTNIEWIIEDPSIIKIEDGEIIALREGTTKISTVVDRVDYVVNITVTKKEESLPHQVVNILTNPKTLTPLVTLLSIISIIIISIMIVNYKKRKAITK